MTDQEYLQVRSRRRFLRNCAGGIGTVALSQLMAQENPLAPKAPHFKAKAKNVIFLFMEGAPSQIDLFDPKPELQRWHGKPLPPSMTKDLKLAFIKPTQPCWVAHACLSAMANPGWSYRTCCPILQPARTTSAWCAPCKAMRSIITQGSFFCSPDT